MVKVKYNILFSYSIFAYSLFATFAMFSEAILWKKKTKSYKFTKMFNILMVIAITISNQIKW